MIFCWRRGRAFSSLQRNEPAKCAINPSFKPLIDTQAFQHFLGREHAGRSPEAV